MTDTHIHLYINGEKEQAATPSPTPKPRKRKTTKKKSAGSRGLPKKYAKMGFKKGWREYKKTAAYKRKKAKR